MLNKDKIGLAQWQNLLHTLLVMGSMLGLLGLTGFLLAGWTGLIYISIGGLIWLVMSSYLSPRAVLRMQRARLIHPQEAPKLYQVLEQLAQKARLTVLPRLYFIPSTNLNAFAVGSRKQPAIGLSAGLLNYLSLRELQGVLAHEMSHIKSKDTQVMLLAQGMTRMTRTFSWLGQVLLILNLPLLLMGSVTVSWWAIFILIAAPGLSWMMQMALSRTREFAADLEAAKLSGDPQGLALALQKLENTRGNLWSRFLRPQNVGNIPVIFRTHPLTQERIQRLMDLVDRQKPQQLAYYI